MDKIELQERTKLFALKIINFIEYIPKTAAGYVISRQIVKSGGNSESKIINLKS